MFCKNIPINKPNHVSFLQKPNKTSIYNLKCNYCNCVFIGQAGKSSENRINDHIKCLKNNKKDSTFIKHNHTFSIDNSTVFKYKIN